MTHVLQAVLKLYRQSWLHTSLNQTCYSLTRLGEFEHSAPADESDQDCDRDRDFFRNKYTNLYTLGSPDPRDCFRFTHDTISGQKTI